MAQGYKGIYIHDTKGRITLRWGANTPHYSAMCVWDEMLVLGNGSSSGYPNLVYADWDTATEEGVIASNASVHKELEREYRTKVYDLGDSECDKRLRTMVVRWRSNDTWASDEALVFSYRINPTRNFSEEAPTFTTIGTITYATDTDTATADDKTHIKKFSFPNLSSIGTFFQFRLLTTASATANSPKSHLDIIDVTIYYDILPKRW